MNVAAAAPSAAAAIASCQRRLLGVNLWPLEINCGERSLSTTFWHPLRSLQSPLKNVVVESREGNGKVQPEDGGRESLNRVRR